MVYFENECTFVMLEIWNQDELVLRSIMEIIDFLFFDNQIDQILLSSHILCELDNVWNVLFKLFIWKLFEPVKPKHLDKFTSTSINIFWLFYQMLLHWQIIEFLKYSSAYNDMVVIFFIK